MSSATSSQSPANREIVAFRLLITKLSEIRDCQQTVKVSQTFDW